MLNPAATQSVTSQPVTVSAPGPRPVQMPRRICRTVQLRIVVAPVGILSAPPWP